MRQIPYTINRYRFSFLSDQICSFYRSWCVDHSISFHNYFGKALSIEELAQKKFQRLRAHAEHSEKELKSEDVTRSDSLAKKQIKKPMNRTAQEPVGSDFSSGATLATPGDLQSGSNVTQTGGFEKLIKVDGPVEGNTSLTDNILDKAEGLSSGILS